MKKIILSILIFWNVANAQVITITATLSGTPQEGSQFVPTDLKYDKYGVFNMEWDDRASTASAGYTLFSGKTFTDGCGNGIPYTAAIAVNGKTNDSTADYSAIAGSQTLSQLATFAANGWALENHGFSHDPTWTYTTLYNSQRNRQYIYDNTGYVMRTGVVPAAYTGYNPVWEQQGYLGGTSQNVFDSYDAYPDADFYRYDNITNFKTNFAYKVFARSFNDTWNSTAVTDYTGYLQNFFNACTSTDKQIFRLGSHSTDGTYFPQVINYIGTNGGDKIWVCSLQEMLEYFETIQKSIVKQTISGNQIIITIDQSNIPDACRWRDMTFKLSSNVTLVSATVSGGGAILSTSQTAGLINFQLVKATGFQNPSTYAATNVGTKVPLVASDVYVDNNRANKGNKLVDGDTTVIYDAGISGAGSYIYTPVVVSVDLSRYNTVVKSVKLHDLADGIGPTGTKVYLIRKDNGQKVLIGTSNTNSSVWETFTPSQSFVALRIDLEGGGSNYFGTELEVYGDQQAAPTDAANIYSPLKKLWGVNSYWYDLEQDPTNGNSSSKIYPPKYEAMKSTKVQSIRFYTTQEQLRPTVDSFAFNPTVSAFYTDTILQRTKTDGIDAWLLIMNQSQAQRNDWVSHGVGSSNPYYYADRLNKGAAATWSEIGNTAYVTAARYGRNANAHGYKAYISHDSFNPPDTAKKALNYSYRYELINEWDAEWTGDINTYMLGKHFAMASKVLKDSLVSADTSSKLIMSGMGVANSDALHGALDTLRYMRGYNANGTVNVPWDYINYHKYSNDVGGQFGAGTIGFPVELSGASTAMDDYVQFRNRFMPNRPIIISEYGWDENQSSTLRAPAIGSYTVQEVIGIWNLRAMLVMASKGINEAQYYNTFQENAASSTNYASMGILNHVDDVTYTRKPVADYARQMVENFGDYVYDATLSTSPYVMRFKNGSNVVYFVWKIETATPASGTYTLTENTGTYNLSLPTNPAITVKNFQTANDNMTSSNVQVTGGTYAVSYGMKPVVVEVVGSSVPSGNFIRLPKWKKIKFKQASH